MQAAQLGSQKHLGILLDSTLNFDEHLRNIQSEVNRIIVIIRNPQKVRPRPALLTIYKSFALPHLDYDDIIYDKAYNESFKTKKVCIQYNAALAITGAIKGSSREKLYQELGLESLSMKGWHKKLSFFFKFIKAELTIYKSFALPHLDYGDIIYDKAYNESFKTKKVSIQYNAGLAITGAIKGSSRETLSRIRPRIP